MVVKNEFNLSDDELYYINQSNQKNIYESTITDLKYLFPKIKSWDDIPPDYRLKSIYEAFNAAYDNSETLEMCDSTEEAFLDNKLFKCIIDKKYSNMKSIFENSIKNFYEPILQKLFNAEFLDPSPSEEFSVWSLEEKIEPFRAVI